MQGSSSPLRQDSSCHESIIKDCTRITVHLLVMATKLCRSTRVFSAAVGSPRPSSRSSGTHAARCLTTTARQHVAMPPDAPNPRDLPREPQGVLKSPIVNPADKYASKADKLHRYGTWIMGCLPKYVQQFSVWKDELTIYIPPNGVIPVFSFLKCMSIYSNMPPNFCTRSLRVGSNDREQKK